MDIYPDTTDQPKGYPTREDFFVSTDGDKKGFGLFTRRAFKKGEMMARFTGEVLDEVRLHTLQISPTKHLHDPHFVGYLLHACDPNVALDMKTLTMWALKDITEGEALTMDYTSTEDVLYRQFPCLCEADNCRKWITGKLETLSEEGNAYLSGLKRQATCQKAYAHA
ncbi:SET domain-containing protein-lysine N-methyltransferase [Desulfoluna spongiiphila]|uniref:SET domain-containing protein n=1 Tax=Desulfoluna spongiiphila TaxID=419481 RepID=A0A1G5CIS7_9BACT|nr:SET domain-containing protein-lysine N-methyltransferase [Desulfoluna spongiiphila]SCY02191.1 SET domain-containing protein [Desulfoluna spongiiphila]VVS92233.1 set domain [Desulfoluna spongiiphila]